MFGNPVPGHILDKPEPWPGPPQFRLVNTFQDHLDGGRPPGIDIGDGQEGAPVLAAAVGIVAERFQDANGALILRVQHPALGRVVTGYAHLQSITAQKGQLVVRGEQIGTVGSSGAPGQPHLHFGVSINGQEQDGWPMLDQNQGGDMPALTTYAPAIITLGGSPLPVACRAAPSQSAEAVYALNGGKLPTVGTIAADGTTWYPVWDTSPGQKGWYYVAAFNVPAVTYLKEGNTNAAFNEGLAAAQAAVEAVPER